MRKSIAIVLLVVIAVSGLVVGWLAPGDASAYRKPELPAILCFYVPSILPPCVLYCCTNGEITFCQCL